MRYKADIEIIFISGSLLTGKPGHQFINSEGPEVLIVQVAVIFQWLPSAAISGTVGEGPLAGWLAVPPS